jgi:hypothetical protein
LQRIPGGQDAELAAVCCDDTYTRRGDLVVAPVFTF